MYPIYNLLEPIIAPHEVKYTQLYSYDTEFRAKNQHEVYIWWISTLIELNHYV